MPFDNAGAAPFLAHRPSWTAVPKPCCCTTCVLRFYLGALLPLQPHPMRHTGPRAGSAISSGNSLEPGGFGGGLSSWPVRASGEECALLEARPCIAQNVHQQLVLNLEPEASGGQPKPPRGSGRSIHPWIDRIRSGKSLAQCFKFPPPTFPVARTAAA